MAYYNPTDQDNSYYDPYQNSQETPPSAISAIGNAAKMLAIMGGLNLVGNMAAGKISGMLGRSIKAGVLGKNTTAYALSQNLKSPSIGGILKQTSSVKAAKKWISQTAVGQAMSSRAIALKPFKGTPGYGGRRVLSAFKNPATLAGVVGSTWVKTALAGAPVAYAVDSALGITGALGLQKKALWDIPGQIGNAAKWMGYESIYATTFGALGPLAGASKSVVTGGIRKAFKGPMGKFLYKTVKSVTTDPLSELAQKHLALRGDNFFKETLVNAPSLLRSSQERTFATGVVSAGLKIGQTMREVGRYAGQAVSPTLRGVAAGLNTRGTPSKKIKAAWNPVKTALQNAKSIAANVGKRRGLSSADMNSDGIRAVELVTAIRDGGAFGGQEAARRNIGFKDFVQMAVPELTRLSKKNTTDFIHSDLSAVRIKDIASVDWVERTFGKEGIGLHFPDNTAVDELKKSLLNMRVGTHIYKGAGSDIVGGGVNLAAFDPIIAMKRALSFVSKKDIHIPLTSMKFRLGDLGGWNDALAKKQDLHVMRHKPNISLGLAYGDPKYGGAVSIGDLASDKLGKDPLFVNIGTKWGIFDGERIQTVDTGKVLRYSRPNSRAKTREIQYIQKQNLIKRFGEEEAALRLADHRKGTPAFNNRFLNWLDNRGVQIPGIAQQALRKLNKTFGNEADKYSESASKLWGSLDSLGAGKDIYMHLPNIEKMMRLPTQILSRLLHDKRALVLIGEHSGSKRLKKNFADVIASNAPMEEKFRLLGLDLNDKTIRKSELHESLARIKAFPEQAQSDIIHKKIGIGSDMNSYDIANVHLANEALNSSYWNHLAGDGMEHPIGVAAGALRAEGFITTKEMKALQLGGRYAAFESKSLYRYSGSFKHSAQQAKAVNYARRHAKTQNWNMLEDTRDLIANNDLRSPHIANVFEDTLSQENMPIFGDVSPYASAFKFDKRGWGGALGDYANSVSDTLGNLLEAFSPIRRNAAKHFGLGGTLRYIGKNTAVVGLMWQGYRMTDALASSTPLLDNTSFDEGITGFVSDNVAKTRLVAARLGDKIGITALAKHMEGLMPKINSTLPGMIAGAVAGRALGYGLGKTAASMAWGGVINRLANPYLPDASKSYEELKEIYSGRETVPMMKSPTWLLGSTPWEGSKVEGFTPNWYVRAKSRWKETETMYGSAFRKLIHEPIPLIGANIGDVIDPYYMERLHYFDRPYPETGDALSEIPIFGKLIAPTLGRIIKPKKTMHSNFLANDWEKETSNTTYPFKNPPPTIQEQERMMNNGSSSVRSLGGRSTMEGNWVYGGNRNWADTSARQFLMEATNAAGLQGFLARSVMEKAIGAPKVIPTLETAGRISSMARSYYDMNLGGMGIITEPVRRLIEKQEYARYGLNPIPNMMPNWLSPQFLTGDPYTKIMKGELRLPGCILPNTYVLSEDGLKYAKDISTSDKLLTLKGYKKVNHVIPSFKNEEIFEIDAYSGLPVSVTGNHHILAIKTKKCKYYANENKCKRPCKPFSDKSFCKNCKNYLDYSYEWIPTEQLEKGDYLVLPKVNKSKEITNIKTKDIVGKFGIELDSNDKFRYTRVLNGKKCFNNKSINFPKNIELDETFMYFVGYYLAEGSVKLSRGKVSGISLTCSLDEIDILNEFKDWLNIKYNINARISKSKHGNYYTFEIGSVIFGLVISELFGYSSSKKLQPKFANNKYLLAGLFDGDATVSKENIILTHSKKYKYSYQLPLLLLQENIPYSIREKNKDIFLTKVPIEKINRYLKYKNIDCISESKSKTYIELKDRFLIKIRNIKKLKYSGIVYDYEVKSVHNYTTSFLMHNSAYQATHTNIRQDMPGRASLVGGDIEHIVQYFTGLLPPALKEQYDIMETGTLMHKQIQDHLAAEGLLVSAENFVVDERNDITGHVDAIIKDGQGGGGRRALEIKTINSVGFEKLDGPKYQHVGQLNFYLKQLKIYDGTIMYIQRDNPAMVKTYDVSYSKSRWEKDLAKLQKARQVAADMMQQGVGDKYGYSYSWLDRLNILSDVAPTSKEYKEAKLVVERQIKSGMFTEKQITKYKNALKNRQTRIRKYELYPLRFAGKVMNPDTERNIQSINEDIKPAAEYPIAERIIGSLWEKFTNTNFFVVNKLWSVKDPLEHYKLSRLYGKEFKPWDEPVRGWLEPLGRGLAGKRDPFTGALGWATAGYVLGGGGIGAVLGGAVGAGYGTVHGMYRDVTNTEYIPGIVNRQRDIEAYFDAAKYEKNQRLSMLSNGLTSEHFNTMSQATLTSFNQGEEGSVANLFRGTSVTEKPYIEAWLKERDPQKRNEILGYIPSNLGNALRTQWGRIDQADETREINYNNSATLAKGGPQYQFDAAVFDPNVELEDIKLKTLESQGFDAHEFGLGWNKQQYRMSKYQNEIHASTMNQLSEPGPTNHNLNQGQIRSAIINQLNQQGIKSTASVNLNTHSNGNNIINVIIKRDRSRAITDALYNRNKWM